MTKKSKNGATGAVGYGHPPKEHRWPPGTSGNPSGKSKQKLAEEKAREDLKTAPPMPLAECLAKALAEPIKINSVDGTQVISCGEAIARLIVRMTLKAEKALDFKYLIGIIKMLGVPEKQEEAKQAHQYGETEDDGYFSEEDRRLIEICRKEVGLD